MNHEKKSKFNLPIYINIPIFLYQDDRLDKSALLIAAFFYSISTAGEEITASTDYLCNLAKIQKRQLYNILNILEEFHYIKRSGFTNRKKIEWVYCPNYKINVTESDTSAMECTSAQKSNTSAMECTKLVQSSALNYCNALHTDNKVDNKDYITTTTVPPDPSSSSFFSEKQKDELLSYKHPIDSRADEVFLAHCQHHIEKQDNDLSKFQRFSGLRNLLFKLYELNEVFNANGFKQTAQKKSDRPSVTDFQEHAAGVKGFEWVGEWIKKQA